jgi:dihydroorotase
MLVLIKQAKIVDSQSDFHNKVVDILIEKGKIKTISPSIDANADHIIEGKDLCISPGWVDIFADYREPGFEQKETIASGLNAAAAGGFTHVFVTPNTNPVVSTKSIVEFVLRKATGHLVNLSPLGAISKDVEGKNLAEMLDMHSHGAIAFTDGWKPVQNANLMLKALEYVKAFDGILLQLPVENSLSAGGLMNEGEMSTRLGMAGIPEMAETLLLHRDIELLKYTGSKLHVTGISTAESVAMIRKAKASALDITCSVTPYHLALTEDTLSGYSSMYKVTPPLRSEADRQALIAGLKDGTIDCIATHHRPQDWDAKTKEFEYAADGMNLQEITFPVLWNALQNDVDIETLLNALGKNARHIFGLGTSAIKEGDTAELTIFTTIGTHTVAKENIVSASDNSPFIGETLNGKVIGTINNQQVFLNK